MSVPTGQAPTEPVTEPTEPTTPQAGAEQPTQPQPEQQPQTRKIDSLPLWAQEELRDVRAEAAKYRRERQDADRAKEAAEAARLKEQGEFQQLYEKAQAELEQLRSDIAAKDRLELARAACKAMNAPQEWADRLRGDTEDEMKADAKRLLDALPKPVAPSTENGTGRGSTGSPQQTEAQLRERLIGSGKYQHF